MARRDRKLGKGLSAIFGDEAQNILDEIQQGESNQFVSDKKAIKLNEIVVNPYQPRRDFDQDKLQELSDSIVQHGVLTPVLVRKAIHGYELIAGERRLRASKLANVEEIPAIVVDFDDEQMMEVSLIENIQREDLNVIEEAAAYRNLIDRFGYTQEDVARRMNKSRSHITNLLRLLTLPETVIKMVEAGDLSMGHVRPLVTIKDEDELIKMARKAKSENLSVRQVEAMLKEKPSNKIKINRQPRSEYKYPIELLENKLQTKATIQNKKIILEFTDTDDLNRLLELMGVLEDI
ncbi:MAG TPA: ParB/RepB/Spo0J family partition protein [Erysipelothrix sp.]|nr:ParB/RepB/Spo0J family partition protein [Erysipelothrix sp.]